MLTEQGFKRKRYDEYIAEMEQQAKELYGENVNLSDNAPLGKFIKLIAFSRSEENEKAENVYLSSFYETATGISLDHVCKYIGIARIQAEKATGIARFSVDPGITVEAGVIVATTGDLEFVTVETVRDADNNGLVDVKIEAMVAGLAGNVPADTITVINTPAIGLNSVTNPAALTGGKDRETDKELRDRYAESVSFGGSSTLDGIKSKIINDVEGVASVVVIENKEPTTVDGRPPHSFEAVVYGGAANDIAKAILQSKPAGIRAFGQQTVTIQDDSGRDQAIGFSFAAAVQIYVKITITKNASFPLTGNDMVKSEVLKYIGGEANGVVYPGLGMGESVRVTRVAAAALSVPGVEDAVVTLSTNGTSYAGSNIAIQPTQVAQTDMAKVVIS